MVLANLKLSIKIQGTKVTETEKRNVVNTTKLRTYNSVPVATEGCPPARGTKEVGASVNASAVWGESPTAIIPAAAAMAGRGA